jgi:type IV secretory pathway TrbF-like protein
VPWEAEWRKLEHAYQEMLRRDTTAEERAWRAQRRECWSWGLLVLVLGVCLFLILTARRVQTLVQVVQQDATGRVVQVGLPLDLLAYTPEDGQWMDMLSQWVSRLRWRSAELPVIQANRAWVYRHTCAAARRVLQAEETKEDPFKPAKKLITVSVTSVLKTATPHSYQVLFVERTTDLANPVVQEQDWMATLAVGRLRPLTMADAVENRLGLCVTGFDFSPVVTP